MGGGIRSMETIEALLSVGVSRVIIGTAALLNPAFFLQEALDKYGERIVVGIDAKDELVATRGWLDVSDVHYITLAKQMEEMGVKKQLFFLLIFPEMEHLRAQILSSLRLCRMQ
ncbi:hypothetical protein GCM10020331_069050 [Ectobacillus funiculus]